METEIRTSAEPNFRTRNWRRFDIQDARFMGHEALP